MQPSSFLVNIAQQPEFLSAVSRSDIESRKNCATPKRLSSLIETDRLWRLLTCDEYKFTYIHTYIRDHIVVNSQCGGCRLSHCRTLVYYALSLKRLLLTTVDRLNLTIRVSFDREMPTRSYNRTISYHGCTHRRRLNGCLSVTVHVHII